MRIPSVLLAPLVAVALLGSLAACSSGSSGQPAPPPTATAAAATAPGSALDLVGTRWHVEGKAGTTVAFDGLAITVADGDGSSSYLWSAQGDQVIVGQRSSSLIGAVDAPWLVATTGVARTAAGWTLRDASGGTTAALTPDGTVEPTTATTLLGSATAVDGAVDRPASVLEGRWSVAGDVRTSITFADGTWRAATSCTTGAVGGSGVYRVLSGGRLLVVRTMTPIRGCPIVDGPVLGHGSAITAIARAASFRVEGDTLTLYDRSGAGLGSLVRG